MICPGCGCDSFQEAYSEDNVLQHKHFCCAVGCGCQISVINRGYITSRSEENLLNSIALLGKDYPFKKPYLNGFVKQYNKKFYNGN